MNNLSLTHNFGNIEREIPQIQWKGIATVQSDLRWVTFIDDFHGIRAIATNFLSSFAHGRTTPEVAIAHWAPPEENNTETYIENMCTWCSIASDAVMPVQEHQWMSSWVSGIIRQEQGMAVLQGLDPKLIASATDDAYA